jgi:hypothetical protein
MKRIALTRALIGCLGLAATLPFRTAAAQSASDSSSAPQPLAPSNVPTPQAPPSPTSPQTTPGNPPAPATAPTNFWTQNYLTGNWSGFRDQLKNDGISFTPVYTGEVFGNPSGGARQGVITDGLLNTALDIDFDPLTHGVVKDLTFHVNALYIYGSSLSEQYVGDFSNTSNIAAFNTLRLDELWVQKLFWNKKLSLKVGNMAVDNEFFQSNSASLFISGTFGAFTFIANNVTNAPVYPLAAPGVRLQFLPTAQTYVMAGVYGQDDNFDPTTNSQNGTRFALDGGSGMLKVLTTKGCRAPIGSVHSLIRAITRPLLPRRSLPMEWDRFKARELITVFMVCWISKFIPRTIRLSVSLSAVAALLRTPTLSIIMPKADSTLPASCQDAIVMWEALPSPVLM